MTFKSAIASVNHYPKGNTVGYDRTYTLKRDSVLANIPTGYADGYRRVFSNAGHVLIRGQRVPVLGKTSMNTVIVDVTDLPQVASGDEVVLFGKQEMRRLAQKKSKKLAARCSLKCRSSGGDEQTRDGRLTPKTGRASFSRWKPFTQQAPFYLALTDTLSLQNFEQIFLQVEFLFLKTNNVQAIPRPSEPSSLEIS